MPKEDLAKEQVFQGRMIRDFKLYTAQEVFENNLEDEEFVTQDLSFSLKYIAPYERKGRRDSFSDGFDKPKVHVNPFFKKVLSLKDHRELYGVNELLIKVEHKIHTCESEWHDAWKERVESFCELEKRFYPGGIPTESGYKVADAYYSKVNTVIEFQKSFDDEALTKSKFYENERIKLIWLFYLPTLSVFENDGLYKIREDNFYHFFRIEDVVPKFYESNIVFLQDQEGKIYYVNYLGRAETNVELEGTVRYFNKGLSFSNSDDFVRWFKFDWEKSSLFKGKNPNLELRSIEEILAGFKDTSDKMFYLQNCEKKDKNGKYLIYAFIKDDGLVRQDINGYIGYRCYIRYDGRYSVNSNWDPTPHNPKTKKWILLATNLHLYHDLVEINN